MVPLAEQPHLRSLLSPHPARAAGSDWQCTSGDPPAPPVSVSGTRRAPLGSRCSIPTEKENKKPSQIPVSPPGAGPGRETARESVPGAGLQDQVEQPASRETPPLASGGGPLTRLAEEGSLSSLAASSRAVCWFPPIGPRAAPGFPSFVARK